MPPLILAASSIGLGDAMREIQYRPLPGVLCDDGRKRTARVRSYWDGTQWCNHADTWFSVPAYVKASGKTVRGYVTGSDDGPRFHAYLYRRNHAAIAKVPR